MSLDSERIQRLAKKGWTVGNTDDFLGRKMQYDFNVGFSDEDNQFVATCTQLPSLSWLADSYVDALKGIIKLVLEVESDFDS